MSKSFRKDLTGQRFGRWTVLEFMPNSKKSSYWKCRCDCGKVRVVWGADLKNGKSTSCGCTIIEAILNRNIRHNLSKTRLYRIWKAMKQRCFYEKDRHYKSYGGKGIEVCDEWKNDVKAFYDWAMANGYQENLTIDRINVNGNYEPSNCRWVDTKIQSRNKRNNIVIEYDGEKMCLAEVAEKLGIDPKILRQRYRNGDRDERLLRPVRKKKE